MSSISATSANREVVTSELMQELDAIRAMNSCLQKYLEHLRMFRKNVTAMDENCKQLSKVNSEWLEILNKR